MFLNLYAETLVYQIRGNQPTTHHSVCEFYTPHVGQFFGTSNADWLGMATVARYADELMQLSAK